MNIKRDILMFSLLVSCANYLNASDDCYMVIVVDACGKSHEVDCSNLPRPTLLGDVLKAVGFGSSINTETEINVNGQSIPLGVRCKFKVAHCDHISVSTKKS